MCQECVPAVTSVQPNIDAIRRWVQALESREYKQTTGKLIAVVNHEPVGYCCLGVACDLFAEEVGVTRRTDDDSFVHQQVFSWKADDREYETSTLLPPPIADFLGLPDLGYNSEGTDFPILSGSLRDSTSVVGMTELNDQRGWTFAMIAQALRDTYLTDTSVTDA